MPRPDSAKYVWILIVTIFATSVTVFGLSRHMLPLRLGDSFYFMPAMVNYSAGNGLCNLGFREDDHLGAGRLVWHGYLAPMLYGSLMWSPTYRCLFLIQGLFAVATLSLAGLLYWQATRDSTWPTVLSAALLAVGISPALLIGRPEPLASFFIVLSGVLLNRLSPRHHPAVLGITVMLVGSTAPTVAILSALLTGAFLCWHNTFFSAAVKYGGAMAIGVCGIALVTQFVYPFGMLEWLRGMSHHAARVLGCAVPGSLVPWWITNLYAFMYGPLILTSLGCIALLGYRHFSKAKCPIGLAVFGVAFLVASWRFAVWASSRQYNLFPFVPLAGLPILAVMAQTGLNRSGGNAWAVIAWKATLLFLIGLPAIGSARLVQRCALSCQGGLSYDAARQEIDKLRRENGIIALSRDLFVLAEDQQGIEYFKRTDMESGRLASMTSGVLVVKQYTPEPPVLPGYVLETDHFWRAPRIFGLPVARTPEAYNLAVYRKKDHVGAGGRSDVKDAIAR